MIICVKEPKLDKVNKNLFKIIAISNENFDDSNIFNMSELLPPADLFMKYTNGELSKKKFNKKYRNFIEKSKGTNIEYSIFSLGMALNKKANICLTASEKEFRIGYVKVLSDYLSELFGIEVKDLDDVNNEIKFELESYSKKERKLLKVDDEELSEKKRKFKEKIIKSISKSIREGMSEDGIETYNHMDRSFAIDQLAMVLIQGEAVKVDKKANGFKDIDMEKLKDRKSGKVNIKPYITSLFIASDESKKIKKLVKSVFESHDIKFKEKTCKKLDPTTFVALFGEIYGKLLILRSGAEE